jgi:branched-chain amino acid transport system ATP-binding protein
MNDFLLSVNGLKVNYGPISAVKGISLNVKQGAIVALLGANGAGKTTTLKTISGLIKPLYGQILLDGEDITKLLPHNIAKKGIAHSPEGRLVLVGLTVEENLRVGAYCLQSKNRILENYDRVYNLFPILKERRKQQSNTLSGGEQQMLAIGRALMASPKLLLLDEPSLGLAPLIVKEIFSTLKRIKAEGTTILMVEQNALQTLNIADYAYVLELGTINIEGDADELIKNEKLVEAYLGGSK